MLALRDGTVTPDISGLVRFRAFPAPEAVISGVIFFSSVTFSARLRKQPASEKHVLMPNVYLEATSSKQGTPRTNGDRAAERHQNDRNQHSQSAVESIFSCGWAVISTRMPILTLTNHCSQRTVRTRNESS
jgi:hypothetical protein